MIKVKTDFPIAFDSPDHIHPWGTMRDNSTNLNFVVEVINKFHSKINFMDLGCSGGKLVRDFIPYCTYSVGLEGSDYSAKNKRAEWIDLYNKNLFTCDVSRDYTITNENEEQILFDCISAWEVVEHIHPDRLDKFFFNIWKHLKLNGIFVCSISIKKEILDGLELHQSAHPKEWWDNYFNSKKIFLDVIPEIKNRVRNDDGSFQKTFIPNPQLDTTKLKLD
jgi:cyclopropane fatty-acyl-phospholipid synthase-like methyltransferase